MSNFEDLDFYELLGVERSAAPDEIKRAYRREINKYHPDRFINGTPDQQEYARLRSQRLTEAYATLSDFTARTAYNAGHRPQARLGTRPPRQTPGQPRDYQAELYDQAVGHLADGRTLQAIGVLRQLQQINPFYRDSAELLAQAEGQAHVQPARPRRKGGRPLLLASSVVGVAVVAVVAWALSQRGSSATGGTVAEAPTALARVADTPTQAPAAVLLPTAPPATAPPATAPPATVPPATVPPATVPPEPTVALPTAEPPTPEPPTPEPPTAVPVESGTLLLSDSFETSGWASLAGGGWSVGYRDARYRIAVNPGIGTIWSYRALGTLDYTIGVDVQAPSGEGGVLIDFVDQQNYLSFSINPTQTSYRLEQRSGGVVSVLAGGQTDAISPGAEAINRIAARLSGDRVELFANGQPLADLSLPGRSRTARYGLLAISGETAAEAFFDNLQIHVVE